MGTFNVLDDVNREGPGSEVDFSLTALRVVRSLNPIIEDWRMVYNIERPHSSLKYQTPEEFAVARQVHKAHCAQALEIPDGFAPTPSAHVAK